MNIYEVVQEDHRYIRDLLLQLEGQPANDHFYFGRGRNPLFREFEALVLAHSEAEEQVLYARLRRDPRTANIAREGSIEHDLIDELFEKLNSMRPSNRDWMPTFKVLKELLGRHMAEEETELFGRAREVIGAAEAERLGERMLERRAELLEYVAMAA